VLQPAEKKSQDQANRWELSVEGGLKKASRRFDAFTNPEGIASSSPDI
jgi:hypothetical protein